MDSLKFEGKDGSLEIIFSESIMKKIEAIGQLSSVDQEIMKTVLEKIQEILVSAILAGRDGYRIHIFNNFVSVYLDQCIAKIADIRNQESKTSKNIAQFL